MRQTQKKSTSTTKKKRNRGKLRAYGTTSVQQAMNAVHNGMSKLQAAKLFKVPRSTLQYQLARGCTAIRRSGPPPVLPEWIEIELKKYLLEMAKRGFPLKIADLRNVLGELLKNSSFSKRFKYNSDPSRTWAYRFIRRHPELKTKAAEHHSLGRATVTVVSLRAWYINLEKFAEDSGYKEIFSDPARNFNLDETAFYLNDNRGKFIGRKYECLQQLSPTNEKENITVAINLSAAGKMAPPMVVLKRKRLTPALKLCCPQGMFLHRSVSGWMKGVTFLFYLKEFAKYLVGEGLLNSNNNDKKVVLYVDGHSSHLCYEASMYCQKKGIILYCLYPNATHVQQPADKGVMASLQSKWAEQVQQHRQCFPGKPISAEKFPMMAMEAISKIDAAVLVKAFECCGLYPFDFSRVDISKLLSTHQQAPYSPVSTFDQLKKAHALESIEQKLSPDELATFNLLRRNQVTEPMENCRLYQVWRSCWLDVHGHVEIDVNPEAGIVMEMNKTLNSIFPDNEDSASINSDDIVPATSVYDIQVLRTSLTKNNNIIENMKQVLKDELVVEETSMEPKLELMVLPSRFTHSEEPSQVLSETTSVQNFEQVFFVQPKQEPLSPSMHDEAYTETTPINNMQEVTFIQPNQEPLSQRTQGESLAENTYTNSVEDVFLIQLKQEPLSPSMKGETCEMEQPTPHLPIDGDIKMDFEEQSWSEGMSSEKFPDLTRSFRSQNNSEDEENRNDLSFHTVSQHKHKLTFEKPENVKRNRMSSQFAVTPCNDNMDNAEKVPAQTSDASCSTEDEMYMQKKVTVAKKSSKITFICNLCCKVYFHIKNLNDHISDHHKEHVYCVHCKFLVNKQNVLSHEEICCELNTLATLSYIGARDVKFLHSFLSSVNDIEIEAQRESSEGSFCTSSHFICNLCCITFTSIDNLNNHVSKLHKKYKYCNKCRYLVKVADKSDREKHNTFLCDVQLYPDECIVCCQHCAEEFKSVSKLYMHINLKHPGTDTSLSNYNVMYKTSCICWLCSKVLRDNVREIQMHLKIDHGKEDYSSDILYVSRIDFMKCVYCSEYFNDLNEAISHISELHPDMPNITEMCEKNKKILKLERGVQTSFLDANLHYIAQNHKHSIIEKNDTKKVQSQSQLVSCVRATNLEGVNDDRVFAESGIQVVNPSASQSAASSALIESNSSSNLMTVPTERILLGSLKQLIKRKIEMIPVSYKSLTCVIYCPCCKLNHPHADYMVSHLENCVKPPTCKCPFCELDSPKVNENLCNFLTHIRNHFIVKQTQIFRCGQCNVLFFTEFNLKIHVNNEHSKYNIKLKFAKSKSSSVQSNLLTVASTLPDKTLTTVPVEDKFKDCVNIVNTLQTYCRVAYNFILTKNKKSKLVIHCTQCWDDLTYETYFGYHLKQCSLSYIFQCPFCASDLSDSDIYIFLEHMEKHFTKNSLKAESCTGCNLTFFNNFNMIAHASRCHSSNKNV